VFRGRPPPAALRLVSLLTGLLNRTTARVKSSRARHVTPSPSSPPSPSPPSAFFRPPPSPPSAFFRPPPSSALRLLPPSAFFRRPCLPPWRPCTFGDSKVWSGRSGRLHGAGGRTGTCRPEATGRRRRQAQIRRIHHGRSAPAERKRRTGRVAGVAHRLQLSRADGCRQGAEPAESGRHACQTPRTLRGFRQDLKEGIL
jgi:hypothetical protein